MTLPRSRDDESGNGLGGELQIFDHLEQLSAHVIPPFAHPHRRSDNRYVEVSIGEARTSSGERPHGQPRCGGATIGRMTDVPDCRAPDRASQTTPLPARRQLPDIGLPRDRYS
jgi:hypothetical protein